MTASLSLMMIARDEAPIIGRVLEQAAEVCDEMVVVDTGSSDETVQIAGDLGARVLLFPWVDDFAAARNVALQACQGEWLIWLDADDHLTPAAQVAIRSAKNDLLGDHLDGVMAPYRISFSPTGECTFAFPRERLVRAQPGLRWVGSIHETIEIPQNRLTYRDDIYVEHRPIPDRRHGKSERNLRILLAEVAGGNTSSRTWFYLGAEYRDAGHCAEALEAYTNYLLAPGAEWEQYAALMSMSGLHDLLGRPDRAVDVLMSAVRLDPSRSEAFLALGWPYFRDRQWAKALPLYAAAAASPAPWNGFVSPGDYTWRPLDFLGVCLANLGRHAEAIPATRRALALGHPDQDRLRANLNWSLSQLAQTPQVPEPGLRSFGPAELPRQLTRPSI